MMTIQDKCWDDRSRMTVAGRIEPEDGGDRGQRHQWMTTPGNDDAREWRRQGMTAPGDNGARGWLCWWMTAPVDEGAIGWRHQRTPALVDDGAERCSLGGDCFCERCPKGWLIYCGWLHGEGDSSARTTTSENDGLAQCCHPLLCQIVVVCSEDEWLTAGMRELKHQARAQTLVQLKVSLKKKRRHFKYFSN